MKYIIKEQKTLNTLLSILNSATLVSNLVSLIYVIARGYNAFSEEKISEDEFNKIQSLLKQSLANGNTNLSEKQMDKIRLQEKNILNRAARKAGYTTWTELKNDSVKNINKRAKKLIHNK
jgi:hypothetical protein